MEGSQHIGLRFEEVRVVVVRSNKLINTDLQSVHPNIYTKVQEQSKYKRSSHE